MILKLPGLCGCAQYGVRERAACEGCKVGAFIGKHATAQGTGGDRRPWRHERLPVAAGGAEELVAAQEEYIQRLEKA